MIDAPVAGSVPAAEDGTLTIMVGGPDAAFGDVEPLLRRLGRNVTHVGGNGQGLLLKLAINISLATQMLAFSEGLLLAESGGIDPEVAARAMAGSPIGSPMLQTRLPLVLDLPDDAWFDVRLMHKDIRLALAAARAAKVPLLAAAASALTWAEDIGYGHRDIAGLLEILATTTPGIDSKPARPTA
jgi:3-hydroxyisobutyrate dehydrogenase-like beta-hydroxyacid dehydrogenase